jgi:hypothetical protein
MAMLRDGLRTKLAAFTRAVPRNRCIHVVDQGESKMEAPFSHEIVIVKARHIALHPGIILSSGRGDPPRLVAPVLIEESPSSV